MKILKENIDHKIIFFNPSSKILNIYINQLKELKYFYETEDINGRNIFICALTHDNKYLLGIVDLEIYEDSHFGNYYGLKYVSVNKKYQGRGIGKNLVEEMFKFIKSQNIPVSFSSFTDEGSKKLRSLFIRLQNKYKLNNIGRNLEEL
jgi:ribosomal protein S18 acetylase RimI-like enzyme